MVRENDTNILNVIFYQKKKKHIECNIYLYTVATMIVIEWYFTKK